MNGLIGQHLVRAWERHGALQMASISVMTLVLMILNLFLFAHSAFNLTLDHWGRGLEMIVYLKEGQSQGAVERLRAEIENSHQFDQVHFTDKKEATQKFLTALGSDSLALMSDPRWQSPIPSSFELRLSDSVAADGRLKALQHWGEDFKGNEAVEDVFYGQGWIENFAKFMSSVRGAGAILWLITLSVGLLIVSNCIRLSFSQRREEIEILELVGATAGFIRTPFLLEGLTIGLIASLLSLGLSFGLHELLLTWVSQQWSFWGALQDASPLQTSTVIINLISGLAFGYLGSWNCLRGLNTGWAAAG